MKYVLDSVIIPGGTTAIIIHPMETPGGTFTP